MTDYRTTWAFLYRGDVLDLGTVIAPETAADHREVQLGWNIGSVVPVDPDAPIDPPPVEPPPVEVDPPEVDGEQPGHPIEPMTSNDAPVRSGRGRR